MSRAVLWYQPSPFPLSVVCRGWVVRRQQPLVVQEPVQHLLLAVNGEVEGRGCQAPFRPLVEGGAGRTEKAEDK